MAAAGLFVFIVILIFIFLCFQRPTPNIERSTSKWRGVEKGASGIEMEED